MQSKGLIRLFAILLALASIWQLSFTAVTRIQEKKAAKVAAERAQQYVDANNVAAEVREFVLDSVANIRNRAYIDSISAEKVYLGYTYQSAKEKEINLGLDLKGGMNVMLQVQLQDLVKALAGNSTDPDFLKALELAKKNNVNSSQDFIGLFESAWAETANGRRLAEVFGTYELRDKVKPESTDKEVIEVIRNEAKSAIDNSFNVLRNRIDRFGVTQPNIQRIENSGKILIELPGVKDPERVRKLLQGTASLEFWPTFTANEVNLYAVDARVAEILANLGDSTAVANPLLSVLQPSGMNNACIGFANGVDTVMVNRYLAMAEDVLPQGFRGLWTVKPSEYVQGANIYELVAIKATSRDGKAPLDGGVVTDASVEFDGGRQGGSGAPHVSMTMNAEGASAWAHLTKDNIGKQIAIVLDGLVYSYPNVLNEITGGSSQITGNFDMQEAEDLANVLKSGKLPAPATIIQEQVVGPSLGSASIRAGLISFLIAFLVVLLYMVLFYKGAGLIADVALLCNVLLLFGTLVSFGAVLTLPGIAGLILTLGMAVDANVIIYERIKEELRAGKSLANAVDEGFKNAMSAIIDGQVTTFLLGLVLIMFGSGTIQGFAVTLCIGIVTSLFTSIFITRLVIDWMLNHKKKLNFSFSFTENFMRDAKVDFMGKRKVFYIIGICAIVLCFIGIFGRHLSMGIDFTGGRTYVVRFDQDVNVVDVRSSLAAQFEEAPEVKSYGPNNQVKITTNIVAEDYYDAYREAHNLSASDTITDEMVINEKLFAGTKQYFNKTDDGKEISLQQFADAEVYPYGIIQSEQVEATMATDMKRNSILAVLGGLLVIFAYIGIRFRSWRFGVGSVAALTHDTILIIGMFALLRGLLPFSLDVDQSFIAAVLTVIGYSINATVVIFDRVRENRTLYPKRDLVQHMNDAINATLARTINTSGTTFFTLLMMFIFGGEVIRGFIFALLVGVVCGVFSSVCLACPIVYEVSKRREAKRLNADNK